LTLEELRQMARDADIQRFSRLKKPDLILALMRADAERRGLKLRGGVLEISHDGVGFLRAEKYLPGPNDIYVAQAQIKRFNLRTGDMVIGQVRPPKDNEKYHGLLRVDAVNGVAPDENKQRPNFEDMTPIFQICTTAWAFCARKNTCPARTIFTSHRLKSSALTCGPATWSLARCARRRTTKNIMACCASMPSTASRRTKTSSAPILKI